MSAENISVAPRVRRRATLGSSLEYGNQGQPFHLSSANQTENEEGTQQSFLPKRRMTMGATGTINDLPVPKESENFEDVKKDLREFNKKMKEQDRMPVFKGEFHRLLFKYVESRAFSVFILIIILLNTGMLIAQTWIDVVVRTGWYFTAIDNIFLGIYITEVVMKLGVWGHKYFKDGWNILDFTIVLFSTADFFLPMIIQNMGGFNGAAIFRLLRIFRTVKALRALRVLRTIRFLNTLQVILGTLLQSIRSIGAIVILISLFMYMFAVVGRGLYAETDPYHFGTIFTALFTLFQLLTLDDWFEIYQTVSSAGQSHIIIYLLLYIVAEYFVFLNLFVAVLVDNFQLTLEAQSTPGKNKKTTDDSEDEEELINREVLDEEETLPMSEDEVDDPVIKKDIDSYYNCGEEESKYLQEYFRLLTALEYNNQQLMNQQRIVDMMTEMSK